MFPLLAVAAGGWTLGEILIAIVVLAGVVGIVYIALRQFGITIPPFVAQIAWIVLCVVLAVVAIRFLLSL